MNKMNDKIIYPSHYNYTSIEALTRLIPIGFTRTDVVIKELLDNACDAAEKYGGGINITLEDRKLSISNTGHISLSEMKKIINFSYLISEKRNKRGYLRGQIGHGLKIAMMLILDSLEKQIMIDAGDKIYYIRLGDRMAEDPSKVLSMEWRPLHKKEDEVITISIPVMNNFNYDYLTRYIILNPHITFYFNGALYMKSTSVKKNSKLDIYSYDLNIFTEFIHLYNKYYPIGEIVAMFNVKKAKIKEISQIYEENNDISRLYKALKEYSMKIPPPLFGKDAFRERLRCLGYYLEVYMKKSVDDGLLELGIIETNGKDIKSIVGINGTCIESDHLFIIKKTEKTNFIQSLKMSLSDIREKRSTMNKYTLLLSYSTTSAKYEDFNKQTVFIEDPRVYQMLKNLYKKCGSSSNKSWFLMKNEYKKYVDDSILSASKEYHKSSEVYLLLLGCQDIAVKFNNKFNAPMTIRQMYYQLVSKGIIEASARSYERIDKHLTDARKCGIVDPELFIDRSRKTIFNQAISVNCNPHEHIKETLKASLALPIIDIWEDQDYYIELIIEKDALSNLLEPIAYKKQVAFTAARGYLSLSIKNELRKRITETKEKGIRIVIIYAGDLDPSGWDMYEQLKREYVNEGIKIDKVALHPWQIEGLIPRPVNEDDKRTPAFMREYPELNGECYELDALEPEELMRLTENAIDGYYDKSRADKNEIEAYHKEFIRIRGQIFSFFEKTV